MKTNGRRIKILLLVSILTYSSSSACYFASANQISSKSINTRRSFQIDCFGFSDGNRLRRSKSIYKPTFDEISQSTAEILLLPVPENTRPLY